MNILITGASGFVGQHLCKKLLLNRENSLKAICRNASSLNGLKLKIIEKTLERDSNWNEELKDVDVVVHLAGRAHVMKEFTNNSYEAYAEINVRATKCLANQAARHGVKRFIFISSIKVNGEKTDSEAFSEDTSPQPEDYYGKTKLEAEKILTSISQASDMEVVIIRPPLVYGEGVKANFESLINLCQKNLPIPFGAIHNKRSFIYIDNLIDFIRLCMTHPKAANQTFLVSDDNDISTTELIRYIKLAYKKTPLLVPIPDRWLIAFFNIIGKPSLSDRLCGNLQVDIRKAKALLGWQPPFMTREAINNTVRSFK